MKFLNRSFNEGIVEVEVSSLNKISSESRLLQKQTTDKLNFKRGQSPVEWGESPFVFFVHPSVRPFIHMSPLVGPQTLLAGPQTPPDSL